jgi:hypothetical protein
MIVIYNRNPTNTILPHNMQSILNFGVFHKGNRVENHTIFGSFYLFYFNSLLFNIHIFM